ncbi:MAG: extracellular solute-binding protein [Caloramator sp.]|nr:extracellular solute-binding protein [Caloramator sp.]
MKKVKFISFLCAACLLMTIFIGCNNQANKSSDKANPNSSLTLFHYSAEYSEEFNNVAKSFNEKNADVNLICEVVTSDYNAVLKSKDAAGKLPDIFMASTAGEPALKPYIDAKKIVDVSNLKVIKQLPEEVRQSITFSDGKIYLIPITNSVRGIIYNKELFKKAGISSVPKTLTELKNAVELLKKANITPFGLAGKDGWTLGSNMFQPGQELMSSKEWLAKRWEGKAKFKDNALPVFDFIDIVKNNAQPNVMDTDYMTTIGLFAEEQVAMLVQGNFALPEIYKLNPDMKSKVGFFAIPYTDDASKTKLYLDTNNYAVVSSNANLEAVDRFFDFLINGEGKKLFYDELKAINPYGITYEADAALEDIFNYIQSGNVIANYQYNNMPEGMWQINASALQEYISGKTNREQTLELIDKGWNDLAKK